MSKVSSTKCLIPENSSKARKTAIANFIKFLGSQKKEILVQHVITAIKQDVSGNVFYGIMDRYAVFLLFSDSQQTKKDELATNTIIGYL